MLDELSSADITRWMAYEKVEGSLGARGAWERMAQLLALLAELNRNTKKRTTPFAPAEFLPWLEREQKQMTPEMFRAQFAHLIKSKKGAKR